LSFPRWCETLGCAMPTSDTSSLTFSGGGGGYTLTGPGVLAIVGVQRCTALDYALGAIALPLSRLHEWREGRLPMNAAVCEPAMSVDDVRRDPRHRTGERARPQPRDDVAAQDPARYLGAARVVDHRYAAAADLPEEPVERLRVPGLTGAAEDAKTRKVVLRGRLVAVGHQPADQRGRHAEDRDTVVRDHPPQAVRPGIIRRPLVQDHRRAERE